MTFMAEILVAEDVEASTIGTVGTFRGWGNTVREAKSLDAAWRAITERLPDCATIDQRLPLHDDDPMEASQKEVDEFAHQLGAQVPFVWLSAHLVAPTRLKIQGCRGVIGKAGDVTRDVTEVFRREVPSFQVHGSGMHLDQVLLEIVQTERGQVIGQVPAWKPKDFPMRADLLPDWLRLTLQQAGGRPVYVKARAWLGAGRHGQLDLCEFEHVPYTPLTEAQIWDD